MKLDEKELSLIRSSAIQHYLDIPVRGRLPGMHRDLTEDEKRSYAYLEACVETLSRLGALTEQTLATVTAAIPKTFQHTYLADHIEDV